MTTVIGLKNQRGDKRPENIACLESCKNRAGRVFPPPNPICLRLAAMQWCSTSALHRSHLGIDFLQIQNCCHPENEFWCSSNEAARLAWSPLRLFCSIKIGETPLLFTACSPCLHLPFTAGLRKATSLFKVFPKAVRCDRTSLPFSLIEEMKEAGRAKVYEDD